MALDSVKEILNCETGGRNEKAVRAEKAGTSGTGETGRTGGTSETGGAGETSGTDEARATGGSVKGSSFFENEVMTFFLFFSVKK